MKRPAMRFDPADLDRLAEAYLTNAAAARDAHELERIARYDAENGLRLVAALVARAPERELLSKIASFGSPLETLLASQGAAVIERVEEAARADARWRRCLSDIRSLFGRIPAPILRRVRRAAGETGPPEPDGMPSLAAAIAERSDPGEPRTAETVLAELETFSTADPAPPGPETMEALRAPLSDERIDTLVAAWFTYVETFWAFEETQSLVGAPIDLAWLFLRRLVHDASDPVVGSVAAGPMEDFLSFRGADVIERVERAALRDGRLRTCLAGVWRAGMDDALWERVVRATAGETPPA